MSAETAAPAAPARGFWRDLRPTHAATALVAFLFAASGPVAVIVATGSKGGLTEADLASWVFGSLAINGVISIVFCLAIASRWCSSGPFRARCWSGRRSAI